MYQIFDPARIDFEPYGLSVTRWKPSLMNRTDRHNEIEFNFILSQPITFQVSGQRIPVSPGVMILFWAATPHRHENSNNTDFYYVVTIPLNVFLRFQIPSAMIQAILNGRVLCAKTDDVLVSSESQLNGWSNDILSHQRIRQEATLHDLQALLLRIWSVVKTELPPIRTNSVCSLNKQDVSAVERIAAYLALNYTIPLTVGQISAEVGLASGYAMTLFRKVFGQTMMENLLHHRLAHAQRLLISTNQQVLIIAYESGFGSLSRFNAVFKKICGCSPGIYRRMHRTASEDN